MHRRLCVGLGVSLPFLLKIKGFTQQSRQSCPWPRLLWNRTLYIFARRHTKDSFNRSLLIFKTLILYGRNQNPGLRGMTGGTALHLQEQGSRQRSAHEGKAVYRSKTRTKSWLWLHFNDQNGWAGMGSKLYQLKRKFSHMTRPQISGRKRMFTHERLLKNGWLLLLRYPGA